MAADDVTAESKIPALDDVPSLTMPEKEYTSVFGESRFVSPASNPAPEPTEDMGGSNFFRNGRESTFFQSPLLTQFNVTPGQIVDHAIMSDPELRTNTRFVEYTAAQDEKDPYKIYRDVGYAVADINESREADGKREVGTSGLESVASSLFYTYAEQKEGDNSYSFPVEQGKDRKWVSVNVINKEATYAQALESSGLAPPTDAFKASLATVESDGLDSSLHELGHSARGHTLDDAHNEKIADCTSMLWRARLGEEGMADKMKTLADTRVLFTGDVEHFAAADALLRARHEMMTDPEGFKSGLEGKTFSEVSKVAETKYVLPSDTQYGNQAQIAAAQKYADTKIAHDLYTGSDGPVPEEYKKDPPIPTDLTRDGAITLLRMQASVEENTIVGKDNGLTNAMPQLWAANPQAFTEAKAYMHDNYGIEVTPPGRTSSPEVKATTTAPPRTSGPKM